MADATQSPRNEMPHMGNGKQHTINEAQLLKLQTLFQELMHGGITGNAVEDFPSPFPTSRSQLFSQLLNLNGARSDVDKECGYPPISEPISVELFRQLYDREAIAARVVEVLPKESWQVSPTIYEDEDSENKTEFEEAWDDLEVNLAGSQSWHQDEEGSSLWGQLLRADILSGIGTFGVLLLGIDDGQDLQNPVDGAVETLNFRVEPIYRDVPVKDQYGRIIRNEQGYCRTERVQVGVRRVINKGPSGRTPLVPDSAPTGDEEKVLNAMVDNGEVVTMRKVPNAPDWKYEATRAKARFLNHWQPGMTQNREGKWVLNAKKRKPQDTPGVPNDKDSVLLDPTNTPHTLSDAPSSFPEGNEPTENDWWGQSSEGRTSDGKTVSEITGTDANYAWQGAMPPASLSGTDSQYFGVQFGPSEAMAEKPSKKKHKLLFVRPFDESLVQVVRYEWNIRNPRFGQPVMYRITLNDPREMHSGVGLPMATVFVHWSRIVHIADNLRSSEIFGVPRMRVPLNRLLDLRKIYSADGETYWRNCVLKLFFETHPQLGGEVAVETSFGDSVESMMEGLKQWMVLKGMSAKAVPPAITDPTPHVNIHLEAICIYLGCPIRVFKGSERGELASSQDDASWNDRLKHRQMMYITPRMIVPLIDRLIMFGVLPEPEGYSVLWPDLDSNTDKDKATIGQIKVAALASYVQGGCESTVTPMDLFTRFLGFDEEDAQEMVDGAQKAHEDQETMTMPPQIQGQPAAAPPGTQAHADAKTQADALKATLAAKTQGAPPGAGGAAGGNAPPSNKPPSTKPPSNTPPKL